MPRRPTPKTLDSLKVTLHKLEQTDSPAQGPDSMSELKRVLLNRIADLELSKTLETSDDETDEVPDRADLATHASMKDERVAEEAVDAVKLYKLD
jgi:hypothetical protein